MSNREINPETIMKSEPPQLEPGRGLTLLFRGVRLRCPHCGGGPLFTRWLKMRESCPGCHLILDRGETDYFLGGYTVNFIVAELLIVLGGAVSIILTWPDVPWTLITWGLVVLMILAPIFFYPFAKTLWLAMDLVFRPLTLSDLLGHGENAEEDPGEGVSARMGNEGEKSDRPEE